MKILAADSCRVLLHYLTHQPGSGILRTALNFMILAGRQRQFVAAAGCVLALLLSVPGYAQSSSRSNRNPDQDIEIMSGPGAVYDTPFTPRIAFSNDGRHLAVIADEFSPMTTNVTIFNLATREVAAFFPSDGSSISAVAFSPAGGELAMGTEDARILLMDLTSRSRTASMHGHGGRIHALAYSHDGLQVLSGASDAKAILWDRGTLRPHREYLGHNGEVFAVAFMDKRSIVTCSGDGNARIFPIGSGVEATTLRGHRAGITAVAVSPNGRYVATAAMDATARLWDGPSGSNIETYRTYRNLYRAVAISPDGETLLTGRTDSTVMLWQTATGREIGALEGHSGSIQDARFSPDGSIVATTSLDQTVRLWDPDARREVDRFNLEDGKIRSAVSDWSAGSSP